jgi:hypothetical protein
MLVVFAGSDSEVVSHRTKGPQPSSTVRILSNKMKKDHRTPGELFACLMVSYSGGGNFYSALIQFELFRVILFLNALCHR